MTPNPFYLDANFDYRYLKNKLERINWTIIDSAAATGANFGVFFIATAPCVVEEMWESHKVAGTAGGSVTLDLEKLTSGIAPDSGSTILSAALSLKTTADTPQRAVPGISIAPRQLARGDRLCLKDSGVLTSLSNVTVSVLIRYKT